MAKIYMGDLASVLTDKHGLTKQEAQRFLTLFVETIQDGVAADSMVKIKGLGTFKVISVDPRESVSVSTGERFTIDGHSKLTFTPDTAMKELVNRPFSQFETVVLNEGVSFDGDAPFDDLEEEPTVEPAEEPAAEPAEEPVEEPAAEPAEENIEESAAEPVEEPITEPVEETVEESVVEPVEAPTEGPATEHVAEPMEEPLAAPTEEPVTEPEDEPSEEPAEEPAELLDDEEAPQHKWLWPLIAVVACMVGFAAGYLVGSRAPATQQAVTITEEPAAAELPASLPDTTVTSTTTTDTTATIVQTADTTATVEPSPHPTTATTTPAPGDEEEWKKYEAMDARVRLGAYRIVGTAEVIKAREGDTSARIARRTLGEGMECYIEVYNGISGKTVLTAGQEIKMPKLQWKKKKKSNN